MKERKVERMKKPDLHIVSFSGGKDSTAMLLHMMELGMQIDIVLYCDTWMEFPAMYRHVEKVKTIVEDAGIKFVTLKNPESFKYMMLEHTVKRKKPLPGNPKGYSWAGSRSRWCTSKLKTDMLSKYKNALMEQYNVIEYVGIAADDAALTGARAKNTTAVKALLKDLDKAEIGEDGTIKGLAEQIEALQKSDAYLFDTTTKKQTQVKGAKPGESGNEEGDHGVDTSKMTYSELAAYMAEHPDAKID